MPPKQKFAPDQVSRRVFRKNHDSSLRVLIYPQDMRLTFCCAAYLTVAVVAGASERHAESVDCADIPAAVRESVATHIRKSVTSPACERITVGRSVLFEVKVTTSSNRMQEWVYRPDGSLEESEEEIPSAEAPAAARNSIRRKIGKGQLRKIDRIQRGKLVLYEGEYTVNGVKAKVIVDATGHLRR